MRIGGLGALPKARPSIGRPMPPFEHVALQKLQHREISRIRVYPDGADAIRNGLQHLGAAPAIQVLADQTLKIGSLIFETALGELDASIDTQLAEIQRGFADRLSSL